MTHTINKEQLLNMLRWSLESAPILDDDLAKAIETFHSELNNESVTNEKEYMKKLDKKIVDYTFKTYDTLILENETVFGLKGNNKIELYDATDCKAHFDLY